MKTTWIFLLICSYVSCSKINEKPQIQFVPHFDQSVYDFMIPEGVTNAESVAAIVQYFGLLNSTAPEFSLVGDAKNWFKLGKVGTVKQQNYNLYSVPIVTKADTDIKYAETEKGIYSVKVSAGKDAVADINVEVLSFGPPAAEDKVTTASPIKKKESSVTKIPVEETTLTDTRSRAVEKNETSSLPIESVISDGHKVNSTDDVTLVETTTSESLTTVELSTSSDDEFVTMEKQTAPTTESSISLTSDVESGATTETTTVAVLSKEATIDENAEDITSEVSSDNSNESENTTTTDAAWEPLVVNRFIAENQATIEPSFDETTEAIVEEVGFPEDSSEVTIETPTEQDEDLSTIVDISLEDLEAKLKAEAGEPITVTTTESAAMKTLEKIFKELEDEEKEKEIEKEKEEPEFVLTPELLATIDGSTQLVDNDEASTTTTAEPAPEPEAGSYPQIELQLVDLQTQLPVQELAVTKTVYPDQVVENFEIRNALDDSVSKEMLELSVEPSDIFDITPHYVLSKMPAKIIVKNQHNFAKNEETEITVRAKYADYSNQVESILTLIVSPTAKFGLTPSFNDTIYEFNVPENSRTGDFVGELFAVDNTAKNGSALIYSLIGKNSDLFTMDGGKIVVLCNVNKTCLDYEGQKEYYLIAIATNLAGVSSDPVTIVVHVNDVNDNAPQLVLSDPVLKIQNGQLEPFTIKIADNDTTEVNVNNNVELQGSASKFLAVEEVDEKTHRVQFVGVPEIGTYLLDILVNDSSNPDIETSKISVPVEVLNTNGRARFSQARYTRRINADKLHKGNPLIQLIFNGQPLETVQFVFLSKNPGWFSLEDFGGNIFVGDIPRNGIPSGDYSITVGALDRQTGKVIDRAVVSVEVEGVQESRSIFKTKVFSHVFPQQELSKDIVLKPLEKGEKRRLMIVPESINAWGDQRDSIHVPSSIVKASENAIVIDAEQLKSIRGIQFEGVAIDNPNDRALFTVYVSSDPEDYEKQRLERSKPQFTAPWVDENQAIQVTLPEEAPLNHNVLHIRAFDPTTGKSIKKITVNGAMADFFSYNYEKGSLVTSKLIDYESLDSPSRVFDLQVVAEHPLSSTTANLVVTIQNIDDNAPEIMLAGNHPVQRPLNLRVTENSDPGKVLIKFMIRDGDTEVEKHLFDKFTYALSGEGAANFEIRQGNNSINLVTSSSANLDREHTKENVVMLQVSDEAGNTDILPMFIETVDENDNRPMLESTSRYIQAVENWPIGTVLARIAAVDKDEEDNGRLSFALGGEASKFIAIHPDSGTIRTIASLHGLATAEPYRFQVIVSDHGTPSFSTTTDFDIRIVEAFNAGDKDEQGIRFSAPATDFVLVVPEDTPSNARLLTAKAQSSQPADSHERNIRYSLEPVTPTDDGWLNINPTNGDVFAQSTFDYEKQKFISVYLIATNVYNETQNASRLLRVQVQNTDDNAPEFAVNSDKTGLLSFVVDDTTDADQQKQSVGRLVAFDADAAPFNDIYYYLVPACNPETSHYDIDQKSGEIFQLKTAGNDTKELQTLCAVASSDPNLSADALRTIDLTAINGSFIKFAVRQLSNMIQSEMEHKSVPLAANNSVVVIDSSAKDYNIPLDFLSANESSEYLYKLENVNFYPVEKNVESTSLSLPSVFVNPSNADVRLDPEITETAEGIYSLLIRTFNTADGRQSEPITSQVHRIDNKNRLKFVFDVPIDSLGLKLAEFQERFNNIMQQNTSTSGVRAVFSDPKVYADRWHVRSSVCFHLTRPTEILPLDDTITLTATKTNANDKLMSLYQVFNVVNIDSCQANVAVANATESAGLSKSLLLWITLVLVVLLILFSLVAYTCFVARYRDFLIKQNEQLKEVQKPIPPFAIPQFIDPRHL